MMAIMDRMAAMAAMEVISIFIIRLLRHLLSGGSRQPVSQAAEARAAVGGEVEAAAAGGAGIRPEDRDFQGMMAAMASMGRREGLGWCGSSLLRRFRTIRLRERDKTGSNNPAGAGFFRVRIANFVGILLLIKLVNRLVIKSKSNSSVKD
jgi:hypothetical protein